MTIKTYRARSLREALAMVRSDLGPGASMLHARVAPAGPIVRALWGERVEVAATPDHSPLAELAARTGAVGTPGAASQQPLPHGVSGWFHGSGR